VGVLPLGLLPNKQSKTAPARFIKWEESRVIANAYSQRLGPRSYCYPAQTSTPTPPSQDTYRDQNSNANSNWQTRRNKPAWQHMPSANDDRPLPGSAHAVPIHAFLVSVTDPALRPLPTGVTSGQCDRIRHWVLRRLWGEYEAH